MLHSISRSKKLVRLGALFATATLTFALAGVGQTQVHTVIASYRSRYRDEAEYNTLSPAATVVLLPFVNSDPAWGWQTTAIVENAGVTTAPVTLHYLNLVGGQTVVSDTLAPGASHAYPTTGVFSGSLLITSTTPLAVIANERSMNPAWIADGLLSYPGIDKSTLDQYLTLTPIYRGYQGWDSFYALQNPGDSLAAITSTFYDLTGTFVLSQTDSLPAGSVHFYDAAAIAGLGSSFAGHVVVHSAGPSLAGVVHAVNSLTGDAQAYNGLSSAGALAALGSSNDAPAAFLPEVAGPSLLAPHYSLPHVADTSTITLYNLSSTTANVAFVMFNQSGANVFVYDTTVAGRGIRTISRPDVQLPIGQYSAVVSADQPLGVLVDTPWSATSPTTFTGYSGVGAGSTTAILPYIRKFADDAVTQIIVQNAGSATASVTVTFTDQIGNLAGTQAATIAPGAAHYFDQAASALPASFSGSAAVTSDQPIVALGFISQTPIYSISGRVTVGSGPFSGVMVSAGTGGAATTDASGYYTITNVITGTYTLTPTLSGYSFSPPTRTVSGPPDATGQNFADVLGFQLDLPLIQRGP